MHYNVHSKELYCLDRQYMMNWLILKEMLNILELKSTIAGFEVTAVVEILVQLLCNDRD